MEDKKKLSSPPPETSPSSPINTNTTPETLTAPPSQSPTPPSPPQSSPPPPPQQIASVNLPSESKKSFSLRKKTWLIILLAFLTLAGLVGAVYLVQRRTKVRPGATMTCPAGNDGQPGQTCDNLNKCDVAGGCNPACCKDDNDCPNNQVCSVPNGYCREGKSCKARSTPTATPIPDANNYCSMHPGYTHVACTSLPGDFADCETKPTSLGSCCRDSVGNPYCCWSDGNCSGGQRQGCEDAGGGCIKMPKGTYDVLVCNCGSSYEGSPNPCSENCQWTRRTWNSDGETQCFFETYECGQADVRNYCASIKNTNCSPPTIIITPTPTLPPKATPTPTSTCTGECVEIKAYEVIGENWNEITDFSTIEIGQTVYFGLKGATNCPTGFTQGRVRINNGAWQVTTDKNLFGEYYIKYTIPSVGSYKVEAMIYCPEIGEWR